MLDGYRLTPQGRAIVAALDRIRRDLGLSSDEFFHTLLAASRRSPDRG